MAHPSVTYVFPEMAVLPDQQPLGLHLQFEPPDGLDHGLGCEELAGGATQAVQLPSGRVGAQGHLLFGGGFGHTEVVVTAHGNRHSARCAERKRENVSKSASAEEKKLPHFVELQCMFNMLIQSKKYPSSTMFVAMLFPRSIILGHRTMLMMCVHTV